MPIVQRCYCTRIRSNTMTSMFDYDDSVNLAFDAKIAGKKVVAAKHELLTKTGEFFFMAHSERELAQRMQMVEEDIEKVAYHKLSNVSDSKAKLVRAVLDEWQLRHASCQMCKTTANKNLPEQKTERQSNPGDPHSKMSTCPSCGTRGPNATGAYGTCAACDMGKNPRNPDYGRKDPHGNPVPGSDYPFISGPHINPSGDKKDDYLKWNPMQENPKRKPEETHPDWNPDKQHPDWNPDPHRKTTPKPQ